MNELINDEAVYRLAPATPGLLMTECPQKGKIHPFSTIAVTFEIVMLFRCPSGFKIFLKISI